MSNGYRKISSFRQSRNELNVFNSFRLCREDEISFDNVAEIGNIVKARFDIVERIVRLVAFDNVAWTLLLVWTGLNVVIYLCWPHGRRLRFASTDQIGVPLFCRSTVEGRAFPVTGAKVRNSIPSDVTSAPSLPVFRNRLKHTYFAAVMILSDHNVYPH